MTIYSQKCCRHCNSPIKKNLRGAQCAVCKNGIFRYGLNKNQQISLHESQNKKCLLCDIEIHMFTGTSFNSGVVDHDHKTEKVRGLLCQRCNSILGYIENKMSLQKLNDYMKRD